jgi:hypothetical protein
MQGFWDFFMATGHLSLSLPLPPSLSLDLSLSRKVMQSNNCNLYVCSGGPFGGISSRWYEVFLWPLIYMFSLKLLVNYQH